MVKGAITNMRARKTSDPVSHVWLDKSVGGVYADDIITWLTGKIRAIRTQLWGIRTHAAEPNRYQQHDQSHHVASKLIELVSHIP
jgi:molybdopterin biosynthesis enzyme MoaB